MKNIVIVCMIDCFADMQICFLSYSCFFLFVCQTNAHCSLFIFLFVLPSQYLFDSNTSDMPRLLSTEPLEICYDKLELLPPDSEVTEVHEIILEVHLPPETSQQSRRTHSRRSSCDSGVYSTEGSAPRQNELRDVEEKPGRKIRAEEPDEGVQDICV